MQLLQMRLKNYRRLCEPTTIDFAIGDKNVTIIRAENGSGKTGILMALLFGLFGTVKYDQFQIENDDDVMVSSFLLNNGEQATCQVSVDFLDENSKYTITREIKAVNNNGKIRQDNSNVITKLYKEGIDTEQSKDEIDAFMNNLIGENIRGFLFFDGVKYTELFKQNNGQTKKELKSIIEKMLNINDLNLAISTLNSMATEVSASASSPKLDQKYTKALNDKDAAKKDFDDADLACENQTKKIKELNDNYQKALAKYAKYDEYKKVVEKINKIKEQIKDEQGKIQINIDILGRSCKDQILYGVYSSFGPEVADEFELMSKDLHGGIDLIDTIIASGKCVCSDRVMTESEKQKWVDFKNSILNKETYSYTLISKIKGDLLKIENQKEDSSFGAALDAIIESYTSIQTLEADKDNLYLELPQDETDTESFQEKVINAGSEKLANDKLISDAQKELDDVLIPKRNSLEEKYNNALEKLKEVEQERAMANGQGKKYEFYKKAAGKLISLKDDYLAEAQRNISDRANSYFLELLSANDKALVDRLILDEDYSIKVYDKTGREVFGQLSAGQKLIASMAFVMGLTAEASNAKPTCNFPLVMDTPVSNLDSGNRGSLIKLMPNVVKQWILTPMDTELTDAEITSFERTNKVGKVYELHKKGIKSVIVPYNDITDLYGGIKHE